MSKTHQFGNAEFVPGSAVPRLQLIEVFVATIAPHIANQLMKVLGSKAPLRGLSHLKRIRKKECQDGVELNIILCPVEESQVEEDREMICSAGEKRVPPNVQEIVEKFGLEPYIVEVAGTMPPSKELWSEWCVHWPISWRPAEPHLRMDAHEVGEETQAKMEKYMRRAMEEAKNNDMTNAAVVVDPFIDRVIAVGLDRSDVSPICHTAMEAIAQAAERDLAMWGDDGSFRSQQGLEKRRRVEGTGDVGSAHREAVLDEPISQRITPAANGSTGVINNNGDADADNGGGGVHGGGHEVYNVPIDVLLDRPYLCTGFDLYILKEPCVMCSMALVHSRFQKIVYSVKDEVGGALGGSMSLHGERSLNHRFQVYHLPLLLTSLHDEGKLHEGRFTDSAGSNNEQKDPQIL
ncbi:hypothetical protein BSKO_10321 [Bryopsis sp. KO-2023]|nr:hypothetical protein BSKO_10321 [Bryopsis sp. KO-2023]